MNDKPTGDFTPDSKALAEWQQRERTAMEVTLLQRKLEKREVEGSVFDAMLSAYRKLKESKPNDRSELDRRVAVAITEYEKVLAYYDTFVRGGFKG